MHTCTQWILHIVTKYAWNIKSVHTQKGQNKVNSLAMEVGLTRSVLPHPHHSATMYVPLLFPLKMWRLLYPSGKMRNVFTINFCTWCAACCSPCSAPFVALFSLCFSHNPIQSLPHSKSQCMFVIITMTHCVSWCILLLGFLAPL